jgi:hypothetical protein
MALFTYGLPKMVIKQNEWYPGRFSTAWGVNLSSVGVAKAGVTLEYGQIVTLEKVTNGTADYVLDKVAEGDTVFGVVVRTVDGGISMTDTAISAPRAGQPVSVIPLGAPNFYEIAVPVESGEVPVAGSPAYVSYVASSEGAVREDVDTNKGIALTGWIYAGAKYSPTKGAGECVIIRKTA